MATIDIYDKGQVDALLAGKADAADVYTKTEVDALIPGAGELLPDYSGAAADDVLTIENGAPVWKTASGGGFTRVSFTNFNEAKTWLLANAKPGDIVTKLTGASSSPKLTVFFAGIISEVTTIYCRIEAMGIYYPNNGQSANYPLDHINIQSGIGVYYRQSLSATTQEVFSPASTFSLELIHFE